MMENSFSINVLQNGTQQNTTLYSEWQHLLYLELQLKFGLVLAVNIRSDKDGILNFLDS